MQKTCILYNIDLETLCTHLNVNKKVHQAKSEEMRLSYINLHRERTFDEFLSTFKAVMRYRSIFGIV